MICAANRCREGRLECTRTECGYVDEAESAIRLHRAMHAPIARDPITFAEPEPEEFTQGEVLEKLTRCESALCFIIGAAAVVVLAFIAWQLLPVVASYWR